MESQKEKERLESLTDKAEEKETTADISQIGAAEDKERSHAEKLQKERALSKVKVSDEDIATLVNETELSKMQAESMLREAAGDLSTALKTFIES